VRDLPGEVVAHERPVNSRTAGDDRRLEEILATLIFDLHDHGLDPFALLGVDSAPGRLHARRAVTHAALVPPEIDRTAGSGVSVGGVNVGSGFDVAPTCSIPIVPSICALVARSTRNSSSSLDRSPGASSSSAPSPAPIRVRTVRISAAAGIALAHAHSASCGTAARSRSRVSSSRSR